MKRLALMLLVVAALAASIVVLTRPGAQASPDVTITVNSLDDTDHRDAVLTLREAMKLATGELSVHDLKGGECDQVPNTVWMPWPAEDCIPLGPVPGASSADTIVFDPTVFPPSSPETITLGSSLPWLHTGDDTVDGSSAGVIVDGASQHFVCLEIDSENNTIKGLEIYNCATGVRVWWPHNTIGGSSPGEGNVISGNAHGTGVLLYGERNTVEGNYIGTDASGTVAVPNHNGVEMYNAPNNTIEGNVISGNEVGVSMYQAGFNTVKGNYIGTDASGASPLPNEMHGVFIEKGSRNVIGAIAPGSGEGNVIAFNVEDGVLVSGSMSTTNTIRHNSIYSNGGRGIENENGGNMELAPPTITGIGSVIGTACANCIVDIYSDDEDEGRVYEGSTTADGSGNWIFSGSLEGPNVTATATDAAGNTSEFSAPVSIGLCGDVDCGNTVDAVDCLFILQHVVGMRTTCSDVCPLPPSQPSLYCPMADTQPSGSIDAVDALFCLQHVAGMRPDLQCSQ